MHVLHAGRAHGRISASTLRWRESAGHETATRSCANLSRVPSRGGMSLASTSLLSYALRDRVSATQFTAPPLCIARQERRHGLLASCCRLVPSCPFTFTKPDFNEAKSPNTVSDPYTIPVDIYALYAGPVIRKSDFDLFVVSHSDRNDRALHSWS